MASKAAKAKAKAQPDDGKRNALGAVNALGADKATPAEKKMAKSPAGVKPLAAPKAMGDCVVPLDRISVDTDSGWRSIDRNRVDELKATFERGEYGLNLLRKPSLLSHQGEKLTGVDGKFKLADGKHTIVALMELKNALEAEKENEDLTIFTDSLLTALTVGVEVSVLQFEELDEDMVVAWATSAHEIESNKYRPSTIKDLVDVANRFKRKVPGGTWNATQQHLEQVYGKGRRMFVYRMVSAAKFLSPAILNQLGESSVPSGYIHDNKYFLGGDTHRRMSEPWQSAAITLASADIQDGRPMSTSSFLNDYCSPLKHAESWTLSKRREFGKFAEIASFSRVESFLRSPRGRLGVLRCMKDNMRLEGVSDEQPGIENCRAVVAEMSALKSPAQKSESVATVNSISEEGATVVVGDVSTTAVGESLAVDVEVDPLKELAISKAELALQNLTYSESLQALEPQLSSILLPSSRVFVLIDAPTSKSQVATRLCQQVAAFVKCLPTTKVRVAFHTGTRLTMASVVHEAFSAQFPAPMGVFDVQLPHGDRQHKVKRPAYLIVAASVNDAGDLPTSYPALAGRARPGEKTRMRCMRRDCPLRPAEELDALVAAGLGSEEMNPDVEMNLDDMEGGAADIDMADADGDNAEDDDDEIDVPSGRGTGFIVDLWPFAYGKEFYKHLLAAVHPQAQPTNMVYVSTTAHPSALLAAHDRKVQCSTVLDRVKVHSVRHGQHLLKSSLITNHYALEAAKTPGTKRLLAKDVSLVHVTAPDEQTTVWSKVPVPDTWRSKLDQTPTPEDLEKVVPKLVASELENGQVITMEDGRDTCLAAGQAMKDGDVAIQVKALFFTSLAAVMKFMNQDGNAALLNGPVIKIDGLLKPDALGGGIDALGGGIGDADALGGGKEELFAVMVGAAMYVQDYRGKKARPNVTLKVSPHKGLSDQMLTYVVATRNSCGIAARSLILADFGEHFALPAVDANPAVKRFRGALDACLARQRATQGDGSAPLEPPKPLTPPKPEVPAEEVETEILAKTEDWVLSLRSGQLNVRASKKVRLAAKTILFTFTGGRVEDSGNEARLVDGAPAFAFAKPKDTVVWENTLTSIGEVIKSQGCDRIFGGQTFTKGVPPPTFVNKKHMRYYTKTAQEGNALAAAVKADKVTLHWSVLCQSGKLVPKGLSVVTKQAITLGEGSDIVLD